MSTLILSCSTGQGHNSCAKAIAEYYELRGEKAEVADALNFVSQPVSRFISWGHVTMYRHFHQLFQVGYKYSENHSDMFENDSGLQKLLNRGAPRVRDYIVKGGFTQVICTHVFASLIITEVQKRYDLPIVSSLVATDYTCNPGTRESKADRYFIPEGSLSQSYLGGFVTEPQLITSGIPIRQMFYKTAARKQAKAAMGIPAESPHLLMMCGSMGCGPMKKMSGQLAKKLPEDACLTIVCGTNKSLQKKLTRRFRKKPRIHVEGFVEDISLLMDSADLYLTKPGGISVTEAAAKDLPMVFVDAVAGCEEYNRSFFVRRKAAKTADSPKELTDLCARLLEKPRMLEKMRHNLESCSKNNAAQIIYEQMQILSERADASKP